MLYPKCPSCRTLLANKQIPYEQEMNKICKNTKLTHEEKEKQKQDVLTRVEIINICCRARVMGYVKLIEIIK